jgi:hypothetical protein
MTRTVLGLATFTFLVFWGASSNLSKSGDTKKAGDLLRYRAGAPMVLVSLCTETIMFRHARTYS